jgi:hypothetical protein
MGRGLLLPVPVDNSIPDINRPGVRAKYIVSQACKTIRVPSIRRPLPLRETLLMMLGVDNTIIMNAPAAAMEEPDAGGGGR